jgi:hypothetical protein
MRIQRDHGVSRGEAIHRIDAFLDGLMRKELPGSMKIREPSKSWSGDVMSFSFKIKKGFLGTKISGSIHVDNQSIIMESELPGLVKTFVGEEKIREVINEQLHSLFPE